MILSSKIIIFFYYIILLNVLIGQNEGLPNITGSYYAFSGRYEWNYYNPIYGEAGAFYLDGRTSSNDAYMMQNQGISKGVSFDASRSNKIYGNSSHVTPTNMTYKIWKRTA